MKKWLIYVFITFILTLSVFAFSKDKGLEWLNNNADWTNGQIEDNSFALLALHSNNYNSGNGYNILLQRMDTNKCYPNGNCNVRDTALAALALKQFNYDIKPLLTWLDSTLTRASVTNWYIQIKTDKSGNCTITFDQNQIKKVFVNNTQKIKIDNKYVDWINVEADLGANLDKPIEQIKVDCTKVEDPNILISLLRIVQGTDFYIIKEYPMSIANIEINNACYPIYSGGQCDEQSSFYAAYSLKKLNEEVKVTPYLLDKVDNDLKNTMIYSITNNQKYLDNLISTQNPLGYWGDEDIYVTSFAINSLKNTKYKGELGNATSWLKSKQITTDLVNNGSFGSIKNTAVALYLALTDIPSQQLLGPGIGAVCGNNITESGEQCDDGNVMSGDGCSSICEIEVTKACTKDSDCGTGKICSIGGACIQKSCLTDSDCLSNEKCIAQLCITSTCSSNLDCNSDQYCDSYTKKCLARQPHQQECTTDSDCLSSQTCNPLINKCELKEEECISDLDCSSSQICNLNTNKCESKPEESNGLGTLFWVSLIIIILILCIGGYFAYNKFFRKKEPKKPQYFMEEEPREIKENYQSPRKTSKRINVEESLEHELDKSIKEAEKLLKK
jgi:cysteine-rich repeat protein